MKIFKIPHVSTKGNGGEIEMGGKSKKKNQGGTPKGGKKIFERKRGKSIFNMLFLWILSTFDDRIFNFLACGEHSYQYLMLYTMSLFHIDLNSIKGAKNSIFFGFSKKMSLRKLSRVKGGNPNSEFQGGGK